MSAAGSLRVKDVRLPDGTAGELAVADGRIAGSAPAGAPELDGRGWLVIPRLVDVHVHLDKTLLGEPWIPHVEAEEPGERARLERALLDSDQVAPLLVRAGRLLDAAVRHGTTLLQSHVDIEDAAGVGRFEDLRALAAERRRQVDVAFVAFPQAGVVRNRAARELLDAALEMGAEAVGGLDPATFDGDRDGQLDAVFALADRHGCRVDVHLHEPAMTGTATMRAIAGRARVLGLHGRCAVSHAYALAQVDTAEFARTASAMAEAGMTVVTSVPGDGRLPPLDRLREAGVRVALASDNVRDFWSPYGHGDQLARASLGAYCSNWRTDAQLARVLPLVGNDAAQALGRAPVRFSPGDPADFTLVPSPTLGDALVDVPGRRTTVRAGRIVVRDGELVA